MRYMKEILKNCSWLDNPHTNHLWHCALLHCSDCKLWDELSG